MRNIKYIAAMLALVGTVGSVQANSEVNNEVIKHEIQFMNDSELNEVVGAKFDGFTLGHTYSWLSNAINAGGSIYSLSNAQKESIKTSLAHLKNHRSTYSKEYVVGWIFDELRPHVNSPDNLRKHSKNKDDALSKLNK